MCRILTFSIFCLFLLLDNGENFKLTNNKILSRLRKRPSVLNTSASNTRQSHTCLVDCDFGLSFNDSLVLSENCNQIETNNPCEMIITVSYKRQEFSFFSYAASESLTIDNITYDSGSLHLALLEYNGNAVYHIFDYACASGNYCEWEYAQQIIPKLITLDYQPLYDSLLPKVVNSNGHPDLTECYSGADLVNCSYGTCEYYQSANANYQFEETRDCSFFPGNTVDIGMERYLPGPSRHDYNILSFTCDKDQCNDQLNEQEIRQIVSAQGNEYIITITTTTTATTTASSSNNSSGVKFCSVNLSLYFLSFALMKYFK